MLKRISLTRISLGAGFLVLAALLAPSTQAAEELTVYSSNMQPLNELAAA